jgi:hypothetical protein
LNFSFSPPTARDLLGGDHHSFLIVVYMASALKQTSREATILLYAPALDSHLQKLTELADRVFCIYEKTGELR